MKFILIANLLIASAYNIDTNYPILYPNSATNADQYLNTKFEHSYFGYSVLLHRYLQDNTSWLFIGAPRGNYSLSLRNSTRSKIFDEPGVVYRCILTGPCVEIKPVPDASKISYIEQLSMHAYIRQNHSWFGSAMAIERKNDFLTICAPRAILNIILNNLKDVNTMQGMCYSGHASLKILKMEMSEIEHFDYGKNVWNDPMYGFSVAFAASLQNTSETLSRIVGRPKDNVIGSVDITRFVNTHMQYRFYEIYKKSREISIPDDQSQIGYMMGYAVTSGNYFNRNQPLYACADPGWSYIGQVVIINLDGNFITKLHGNEIGEFFGASLASGDLNNDGLHDLVVGAPHWKNDNGRVHVYLGTSREEFEAVTILEGVNEDAHFGYALAIGDMDGDGFSDIIVSAPWEKSGAIYIYNGDASLKDNERPTISQKITMKSSGLNNLAKRVNIQTFGFSISEPVDIDNNGYTDIAVGAYKSGHVIVLRSKPVVRTNLTLHTIPSILQRNVSNFLIKACVEYDSANTHAFKISLTMDKKYKRTKETFLEMSSMDFSDHMCMNVTITLSNDIQNFIEPIVIYASHNFTHNDSVSEFCKTCPVENRHSKSKSAQSLLPFDIGCGDDRVCNSNISATVKLQGIRENNTWVIGSNDIILETHLENYAEPAYLTTITFILPKRIVLRSILPFCEEDMNEDILTVICNVGNPLGTYEQKIVKLDLDMKYLTNGSLHGQVLEFLMEIQTHSVNHGMHMIKSPLILQSEVSLFLNGKAIEENYYLLNLDYDQPSIIFQHIYQILKFGATFIEEAKLIVNLPIAINDLEPFISLYKPRIYISGKYYDCLSSGVDLVTVQHGLPWETISNTSDLYNLNYNNEILQNTNHDMLKRDVKSYAIIAAHILHTLYNTRMIKSEDLDHNLTIQERNIAYVNCSTYGINCSTLFCDLSALRTQQDIGKLMMKLIFNITKLKDNFKLSDEIKIIKFSTDAHVQIIKPTNRIVEMDIRHDMNLVTEFHNTEKMQKLQVWTIFVSVSLGLILLCIVIILLSMIGFFKRTTKEELSILQSNEETEDIEEITHIFE
ncbi:hypothetical protein P5V15_014819 [Pogonomyrmex californicus]